MSPSKLLQVVINGDAIVTSNITAIAFGASSTYMLTIIGTLTFKDGVQLTLLLKNSAVADSSVAIANASFIDRQFAVLRVVTPKSDITCAKIQEQVTSISVILYVLFFVYALSLMLSRPNCNRKRFPIYLIVLIVIGVVAILTVAVFFVARWLLPQRSLEGAIYDGDNTYNRLS